VTDLALERFLVDELEAGPDREHIIGCVTCRATLASKRRAGDAYMMTRAAKQLAHLLATTERVLGPKPRVGRRAMIAAVAVAIAAVVAVVVWPRGGANPDEAEVLAVAREWMDAYRHNDAAALDRILANDYMLTDSRGNHTTKPDDLASARAGSVHYDVYDASDLRVRLYGDTAILTGKNRLRGTSEGRPFEVEVTFTDTLARIDGRWRAVAAHVSRTGPP
jgi:ketosteroid isomerase-like protein